MKTHHINSISVILRISNDQIPDSDLFADVWKLHPWVLSCILPTILTRLIIKWSDIQIMKLIKIIKFIKFIKFLTPAEYCIAGGFLLLDLHRLPCVLQENKLNMFVLVFQCEHVEDNNSMRCVTWKSPWSASEKTCILSASSCLCLGKLAICFFQARIFVSATSLIMIFYIIFNVVIILTPHPWKTMSISMSSFWVPHHINIIIIIIVIT